MGLSISNIVNKIFVFYNNLICDLYKSSMDPYYLLRQDLEHVLANVRVGLKNREDMLNDKRGIGMDSFTTIYTD